MKTKIIAVTNPINMEDIKTASDLIGYTARVSAPENQNNTATVGGLLNYCLRHKHFSIFEMVNVVMEIETTRDISRQILRHRSFSFQEFSQRYAEVDPEIIRRETRVQDTKNRQNSIKIDNGVDTDILFNCNQETVWTCAIDNYKQALHVGIAKEQARALLPEGLTSTRMYMNGSLRSWIHYVLLRSGVETQKEHRDIAKQIGKQLLEHFDFLGVIFEPIFRDDYSAES